jgi:lipopolysaccharide/colanic/teichoic acid biosynthesis glycosyltransferase
MLLNVDEKEYPQESTLSYVDVDTDIEIEEIPKVIGAKFLFTRKIPIWKRTMDIMGAIVAIIIFSPIMALVAISIKIETPGTIFFKQKRAGIGGIPFVCYKFRSMCEGANRMRGGLERFNERTGPVFKMSEDPRVTRVGKLIRKWSLDEMPQFFNVLKGDMSIVGPRPPIIDEVMQYSYWQGRRLDVKPGITCLWQVYARHKASFEDWVRLDIEYQRKFSFWLDLKILALTLPAVLSRRGAA